MFLDYIKISNLKSIKELEVNFFASKVSLAGWHVFIGDNGSGKSTFIRAISLALIGPDEAHSLRENWDDWLRKGEKVARVKVNVKNHPASIDRYRGTSRPLTNQFIPCYLQLGYLNKDDVTAKLESDSNQENPNGIDPFKYVWSGREGWFSVAYGPFRRFSGGDVTKEKIFYSNPRAAAHITAFGEDTALTEIEEWLSKLHLRRLEKRKIDTNLLTAIKSFLNAGNLLPHGAKLSKISSDGIFFTDGNKNSIPVNDLSDGYRAILSMILEIVRQMVRVYGAQKVSNSINSGKYAIDLPGIVLIDEIDAHLHPTWQVKIGQWFTTYFPNIQFIVTTHSPLICRAAEKGSVWRLASPGSDEKSGQVTGTALNRLIYGNVLDAYGTQVFGDNVTSSDKSTEMRQRLAHLNKKSIKGSITEKEEQERQELRTNLPTSNTL